MKDHLPRNKSLKQHSKQLRNNSTPQERTLWFRYLRTYPVRFNRQRVIGSYIADFYCFAASLVVELDGSQHYEAEGMQRDEDRTAYLESLGLKVIRFTNTDVDTRLDQVCSAIDAVVASRLGGSVGGGQSPVASRHPLSKEGKDGDAN